MTDSDDENLALDDWSRRLSHALQTLGLEVDVTSGHVDTTTAVTNAAEKVRKLCEGGREGGAKGGGWADTAQ